MKLLTIFFYWSLCWTPAICHEHIPSKFGKAENHSKEVFFSRKSLPKNSFMIKKPLVCREDCLNVRMRSVGKKSKALTWLCYISLSGREDFEGNTVFAEAQGLLQWSRGRCQSFWPRPRRVAVPASPVSDFFGYLRKNWAWEALFLWAVCPGTASIKFSFYLSIF